LLSPIAVLRIEGDPADLTEHFGSTKGMSPFKNAGYMSHRRVWTFDVTPAWDGPRQTLGDILEPASEVPERYYIPTEQLPRWQYLKGACASSATTRAPTPYFYVEGPIPCRPGHWCSISHRRVAAPSRFKHIVQVRAAASAD
jgi:DNA (cytosine-5)-methyltransferase 1